MLLNIDQLRCLVVEDDPFKMEGIRSLLTELFGARLLITECQALATATAHLAASNFDLAIVDMSIHSHEPEKGAGSPFPLSSGGLDVLFEIEHLENSFPCIILTQYTDIEIEGLPIPVELARQEIMNKFGIDVTGCVRYLESDNGWKAELTRILEKL